ncbi:hypothetical protein BX661DRAFT_171422 [Kickxella alabastrina]|uniref:uncharacterized protein n=1 Tax=Kickxella alabastrina TaxID=61397 RepID=UPI00221F89F7|nr:uncharacterized protein BX661DRAFT_171422 [Kickxella alabastrina]KAI7826746.1 hypothetical protein BX661DRAFT_171422 [Kickxella alabastrina]
MLTPKAENAFGEYSGIACSGLASGVRGPTVDVTEAVDLADKGGSRSASASSTSWNRSTVSGKSSLSATTGLTLLTSSTYMWTSSSDARLITSSMAWTSASSSPGKLALPRCIDVGDCEYSVSGRSGELGVTLMPRPLAAGGISGMYVDHRPLLVFSPTASRRIESTRVRDCTWMSRHSLYCCLCIFCISVRGRGDTCEVFGRNLLAPLWPLLLAADSGSCPVVTGRVSDPTSASATTVASETKTAGIPETAVAIGPSTVSDTTSGIGVSGSNDCGDSTGPAPRPPTLQMPLPIVLQPGVLQTPSSTP